MTIITVVGLNKREIIEELNYELIAETFSSGKHKSDKAVELFDEIFAEDEKSAVRGITVQSKNWRTKGAPSYVEMPMEKYRLWGRIVNYCLKLKRL